jgi:DNA-binding SARP family transcriptional activator/WD40 repeat protein
VTVEIRALGPLQVRSAEGEAVNLGGPRQRRLLSALALTPGEAVSEDRLVAAIWVDGETLPEAPKRTLQTYVWRLRTALGQELIATDAGGYALDGGASVDAARFETLVSHARTAAETGDGQGAEAAIGEALGLWRGEPFAELVDVEWAAPELARLSALRLSAEEDRLTLLLQRGAVSELLPDVNALIARAPLAEGPRRVLMLALYRAGRRVEALRAYQEYRGRLADETGLDPSEDLVELEQMIIADDPRLAVEVEGRRVRGYVLGDKVAEGAFGDIYRGVQPSVGRDVAIKVIRPELADNPDFVRRFEAEAHLVARLEHPHIVPVVDFWREPGNAYLVMRYLRGGSAEQRLLRDGPWLLADVARLVDELGPALAVAHAHGVIHRDVKPANILFDEAGNSYLADFGIAMAVDAWGAGELRSAGSPMYASPEQIRDHHASERSDIYSFGVVLHELLSGQSPFSAETTEQLLQLKLQRPVPPLTRARPDLSAALDGVLQTATAIDPANRFTDMGEFVLAFRSAVGGGSTQPAVTTGEIADAQRPRARASETLVSFQLELANPYKGLRPFDEADSANFFGRRELASELVGRLGQARFVAVVGPSGSGKSSVVRAGVIPKLRADGAYVATIVPGSHPMDELETALLRMASTSASTLLDQLNADERGLGRCVKRLLPDDDRDLVLVVDQFEELFTVTEPEQREAFLAGLAAAVSDERGRLRVLATLRADFIDRPLLDPTISELIRDNTTLVTPLDAHELREAITGPVERIGVSVEPELVAELITGVSGQPGSLPLLQYALTETYERRDGVTLTHETYERIGGLTGALARRADQLYEGIPAEDRPAVRRLFTRLVTPGEGTEDTRRRVRRSELTGVPPDVIDAYGSARLLSFDRDPATREPTVEVAHEALIREWPRLRSWIDEDRDGLRVLRHLGVSAQAWEATQRDEGELYRGGRLEAAEEFAAANPDELNQTEKAFLDAGIERREQAIVTERRRLRRLRVLLTTVAVIAAIALVAGLIAIRQRNETADARDEADLRRLIGESAIQVETNRPLALLMALEANLIDPSPETLGAIQRALVRSPVNWLGSLFTSEVTAGTAFADERTLIAMSRAGLDVWDLDTRAITRSMELPPEPSRLAISDDRTTLAIGHADGTWEVLDAETLDVLERGDVGPAVRSIALSSDGSLVAIGSTTEISQEGEPPIAVAAISDVAGDSPDLVIEQQLRVEDLAFQPGGTLLAVGTGSFSGSATVHDVATGAPVGPPIRVGHPSGEGPQGAGIVAWHEQGLLVADTGFAAVFDPLTGEAVLDGLIPTTKYGPTAQAATVDGSVVMFGDEGVIERLATDSEALQVLGRDPQLGDYQAIAVDPSGAVVAVAGTAGISLLSTEGRGTLAIGTIPSPAAAVELSEDGSVAMVFDPVGTRPIEVWHMDDPSRSPQTLDGTRSWNRDDTFYLGAGLWQDGETTPIGAVPPNGAFTYALSPDGQTIVVDAVGGDGLVSVVDLASDTVVAKLDAPRQDDDVDGNESFVRDLEFTPDGTMLVVVTFVGGVYFYETETWTEVREPIPHTEGFDGIDFTSDGTRAVTRSEQRQEIELRDATTFDIVGGPWRAPQSVTVGPQNPDIAATDDYVVIGGSGLGAGIWALDLEDDTMVKMGDNFPFSGQAAQASLAGEADLLGTVPKDRAVIWDVDTDHWPEIACRAVGRNMTRVEWAQFGPAGQPYRATCPQWPKGN